MTLCPSLITPLATNTVTGGMELAVLSVKCNIRLSATQLKYINEIRVARKPWRFRKWLQQDYRASARVYPGTGRVWVTYCGSGRVAKTAIPAQPYPTFVSVSRFQFPSRFLVVMSRPLGGCLRVFLRLSPRPSVCLSLFLPAFLYI